MQFYSTNNPTLRASLKEAIFKGLPEDKGLFMPVEIPRLSDHFLQHLTDYSFQEIAFEITRNLLHQDIPEKEIRRIAQGWPITTHALGVPARISSEQLAIRQDVDPRQIRLSVDRPRDRGGSLLANDNPSNDRGLLLHDPPSL